MKTRIRSTHIHDNDGKEDKHLFPFAARGGTIDWPQTIRLLSSRREQYPLAARTEGSRRTWSNRSNAVSRFSSGWMH